MDAAVTCVDAVVTCAVTYALISAVNVTTLPPRLVVVGGRLLLFPLGLLLPLGSPARPR